VVTDALSTLSILLVGNAEGGMCGCEKLSQWGSVGNDDLICFSEDDVLDPKALCTCALLGWFVSVFPNP
jgi:hypothetical protein